jgi:flagellar assembly protein FliH
MPVLKQHHTTPAMREAIVLDLGDIGAQAARIRAAAETQASKIIAEAQAKSESLADQLHQEAEKQGYSDGLEKGLAEGREQGRAEALAESSEQLRQLSAAWSQVATEWEQQRIDMEREARQAVLEFALAAAEKIVHRVIEVDESVVVDQAAQALSLVLSAHDASVRIHPVDRPMLEDAMPELIKELASLEHIELVDDETITPGGCIVAFGQGRIDATVERQLQRLVDLILPELPPLPDNEQEAPAGSALSDEAVEPVAQAMDPAAVELDTEPVDPPPVYEITDDGLVQTQGQALDDVLGSDEVQAEEPDNSPTRDEPESEA